MLRSCTTSVLPSRKAFVCKRSAAGSEWRDLTTLHRQPLKRPSHSAGDGMQQALGYAEILNLPFAFSTNGDGFVCQDRSGHTKPGTADLGAWFGVGFAGCQLDVCAPTPALPRYAGEGDQLVSTATQGREIN